MSGKLYKAGSLELTSSHNWYTRAKHERRKCSITNCKKIRSDGKAFCAAHWERVKGKL